jgi:hypothetical protein
MRFDTSTASAAEVADRSLPGLRRCFRHAGTRLTGQPVTKTSPPASGSDNGLHEGMQPSLHSDSATAANRAVELWQQ